MVHWGFIAAWIGLFSAAAAATAALDKARSRRGARRVRERTLLGLALLGGSPGLALGMVAFRHKTRKAAFLGRFGLVLAAQAGLAVWWFGFR